jgi:hypothetical protein
MGTSIGTGTGFRLAGVREAKSDRRFTVCALAKPLRAEVELRTTGAITVCGASGAARVRSPRTPIDIA